MIGGTQEPLPGTVTYPVIPGIRQGDITPKALYHVKAGDLDIDTAQTAGMRRFEALSHRHGGTQKLWLGENHVGREMNSGDHHHGEAETGIYVVSGYPVFVFLDQARERRIDLGPGDYVFGPPYVPHREENPHNEPAVVVLARSTQEGIVVNLPSLWAQLTSVAPAASAIAPLPSSTLSSALSAPIISR